MHSIELQELALAEHMISLRNYQNGIFCGSADPIYISLVAHPVLQNNTRDFGGSCGAFCVVVPSTTIC